MPHSSEINWGVFSVIVSSLANDVLDKLHEAEETYLDMLEAYQYSGGTDTTFANLLFHGDGSLTLATADEIAKAADLKAAMVSVHELYQSLTNVATTTKDRAADLRRMS